MEAIIEALKKMSTDVKGTEQISQVGMCAANQDWEIGRKIAEGSADVIERNQEVIDAYLGSENAVA